MAKKNMEETVEAAKGAVKDTVEEAKEMAKETVTRAKKTAKKTADEVKKAAQKVITRETYIQFAGAEYKESEIREKVEEAYKAEGHRVSSIKSMELYIKPEEGAAYYVINDNTTGKVEL